MEMVMGRGKGHRANFARASFALLLSANYLRLYYISPGAAGNDNHAGTYQSRTLMKHSTFDFDGKSLTPAWLSPSPDLKKVLLAVGLFC